MKWEMTPWTEEWNRKYAQEAEALRAILQDEIVDMHHVGSTSVEAIGYAKPIIDILIIVSEIDNVQRHNENMISLGYRVRGENGIPRRRYFTKGDQPREFHVHVYEHQDPRIATYLDFKAYLIHHPEEAEQYGQLKLSILEANGYADYQQQKEQRMHALVERALKWAIDYE